MKKTITGYLASHFRVILLSSREVIIKKIFNIEVGAED